jgi:DNA polymerase-4
MRLAALCRDCSTPAEPAATRCRACGSPRLARHRDLGALSIAHVDCDAFYAAIEKRDDPSLADKPVIIGGGRRGVVSTACYVARTYGVKSAMPMFKALKLCPDAVVIPPRMDRYVAVGREVRAKMLSLTPLVEPLSIDEAFLDLSGTESLHGGPPAMTLVRFAREVERDIGITVSVGLAPNKFLAKIASDLDKPRGFSVIGADEAKAFLAPKPVSFIWGVGKSFGGVLERDGYRTIADLQRASLQDLTRRYGASGARLATLAHGLDDRRVDPDGEEKSISAETTFDEDVSDGAELSAILWRCCEKVAARAKAKGLAGWTVTLKLKTSDFKLKTRSRRLPDPTCLATRLDEVGRALLGPEANGTRYRLLGIGIADLAPAADADPVDLVEPAREKRKAAEGALDAVRAKFGKDAIASGRSLRGAKG